MFDLFLLLLPNLEIDINEKICVKQDKIYVNFQSPTIVFLILSSNNINFILLSIKKLGSMDYIINYTIKNDFIQY